jgi:hypothetical protein
MTYRGNLPDLVPIATNFGGGISQALATGDVIARKDVRGEVSRDVTRHQFRRSFSDHIAYRRPPQIVKQQTRYSDGLAV